MVDALRRLGVRGLSVTMPLKDAVVAHCDVHTAVVERLGAANCLTRADEAAVHADSTDGDGLLAAIACVHVIPAAPRCVVLGAGGAARAAIDALARAGAVDVAVVARRADAAARAAGVAATARVGTALDALDADVVVQATPVGMHDTATADATPLVDPASLRAGQVAVDLVYHPRVTPWLARAAAAGAATVEGVEVLVHQAHVALTGWLGADVPVDALHEAVAPSMTLTRTPSIGTRRVPGYDRILAALTVAVAGFGVVMVYSATRDPLLSNNENPHYYLERQFAFVVLGALVMLLVSKIDYRRFEHVATPAYVLSILALIAVKSPLGSNALGSQRWFSFHGIQVQPSEFTVLAMILAIATYCERRPDGLSMRDVVRLLIMAGVPIFLVYLQPDLGTAIIMVIVLIVMLAIAGVPPRFLVILGIGGAGAAAFAIFLGVLQHYQIVRLTSFLGTTPYQVVNAKAAITSGGAFGKGFFHGISTNGGFVPESQTDFIFTAVGEQLGFVGAIGLIVALATIAGRMLRASMLARDHLGRLLAVGVFTFFAFSCFQNVGMIMGIMPVTGIPLPFMSYGGSAAVCFFLAVGVVLSVTNRRAAKALA